MVEAQPRKLESCFSFLHRHYGLPNFVFHTMAKGRKDCTLTTFMMMAGRSVTRMPHWPPNYDFDLDLPPFQIDLIHLGAKYAPCMRWDSVLDREIKDDRLKERDTACCIRKDRSGCVQSPKSECSKINDPNGEGGPPRSKWVSRLLG